MVADRNRHHGPTAGSTAASDAVGGTSVDESWTLRAFSARQVEQLTGLGPRRLWSWDRRQFISPSYRVRTGRSGRRLYDFRDLVSLRVAAELLRQGIALSEIRKAHAHLRSLDYKQPLAELTFWVYKDHLYFNEAETVRAGRRPEQVLAGFLVPVPEIVSDLKERIRELDRRPVGEIERRRGVLGSKPVIKGTRISIDSIRRLAEDGLSPAHIRDYYPDLDLSDIEAALKGAPQRPHAARAG
jgi:DNA-binding transcriptional MerR regulator